MNVILFNYRHQSIKLSDQYIFISSYMDTTTTTRLTSVISALMRVRRSPHDATPPLLSVHCHLWPQPHILHIPIQPCSPSHPWPAPTSAARHFQVPTSAHPIIHLNLPRLITSTTLSIPSLRLSSTVRTLSLKVTPHIHLGVVSEF